MDLNITTRIEYTAYDDMVNTSDYDETAYNSNPYDDTVDTSSRSSSSSSSSSSSDSDKSDYYGAFDFVKTAETNQTVGVDDIDHDRGNSTQSESTYYDFAPYDYSQGDDNSSSIGSSVEGDYESVFAESDSNPYGAFNFIDTLNRRARRHLATNLKLSRFRAHNDEPHDEFSSYDADLMSDNYDDYLDYLDGRERRDGSSGTLG